MPKGIYKHCSQSDEARKAAFMACINKDGPIRPNMETPCWLWTACASTRGYGQFRLHGKPQPAHRVAWFFEHGSMPPRDTLHRCDNPPCVRPDHIFDGSHADNMRDMCRKGRHHIQKNTEWGMHGVDNPIAILNDDLVREIRAKKAAMSHRELSIAYGVAVPTIKGIVARRSWRHVADA